MVRNGMDIENMSNRNTLRPRTYSIFTCISASIRCDSALGYHDNDQSTK